LNKYCKKFAFTLAELLITIGLLGSIAAITLPNLAFNYRGKVLEQQYRATYSEIKDVATRLNKEHGGDWASYVTTDGKGAGSWYAEFMSNFNGGNKFKADGVTYENIVDELASIYKAKTSSGVYSFSIEKKLQSVGAAGCDNGGVWTDNKGRIWTFNNENGMICVDINGTAKPNRVNVDVFGFIPMSPAMLAIWVYDDPENPNNYTGTIVPCDLMSIINYHKANSVPTTKQEYIDKNSSFTTFEKGSGSALDFCPFFEPMENIAPMDKNSDGSKKDYGTSARGKRLTTSNNYWKDYIDYK
jgi:Tfp pilus assembly protein FimT